VQHHDVVVVGAGPAGSSAAWELKRNGVDCLLLDRDAFPRHKLCAGWVTPEVLADLEIGPNDYPHGLLTFDKLRVSLKGLSGSMSTCQHSIRRYEFDAWLVERSGAPFVQHEVREIEETGGGYEIDGQFSCRYLVGAGGTRCPVHRRLFRPTHPHPRELQCVTLELEYACDWQDADCHLWFGDRGLPGYSWYVPKGGGYLNIGVGGSVVKLAARGDDIGRHWQALVDRLVARGLISEAPPKPKGYSYFMRDVDDSVVRERAFAVGDAAGLATRDMCEGIGPAVQSGLRAARSVIDGSDYQVRDVPPFTLDNRWVRGGLQRMLVGKSLRL
jgi:flavin-dependent dehydrogenase